MPSYSTLALAFTSVAVVCAIPVDEISARNGIGSAASGVGGQAGGGSVTSSQNGCTNPTTGCTVPNLSGMTLARINSENAGNGGDAPSGTSNGVAPLGLIGNNNSTSKVPEGSASSGAGGEAPGGSVIDNHPALVELNSDNAGTGGGASSGNSSGLIG